MIEGDNHNTGPIPLTDEVNETSRVFEIFLDLLHGGSLPPPDESRSIPHVEAVISLAKNYDCPGMLYTINNVLRGAIFDPSFGGVDCFIALSHCEDIHGCAEVIRRYGESACGATISNGSLSALDHPLPETPWTDPAAWDYARASRTNFRFLFALFRAVHTAGPSQYTQYRVNTQYTDSRREQVATEFIRLLRSTRMSSPFDAPLSSTAILVQAHLLTPQPSLTVRHRLMRRPISVGHRRDGTKRHSGVNMTYTDA
jgi:hypothetical protein